MLRLQHLLNRKGSSMMEMMAMIALVGIAVTAVFSTVTSGIRFAKDSENRIKAINLAREGIEGVTNLRNTNWLRFSSDRKNCWNTKDYTSGCIGSPTASPLAVGAYTLLNQNGAWYLSGSSYGTGLWVDSNGFYNASGAIGPKCTGTLIRNCRSLFTREITLSNITSTGMTVSSKVEWNERGPQKVILETTLTNWRSQL